MRRLLFIGLALLLVAAALFVVGLAALLLVVFAYGLSGLLTRFLPIESNQATLLALIASIAVIAVVWQILSTMLASPFRPFPVQREDDDWDEEESDDEFDEDDVSEDEAAPAAFVPSIPLWRQPLKTTRYEGTDRNARCPCGSGRKFKNCHGRTT